LVFIVLSFLLPRKLHTHFNRGYLRTFSKFNRNVMYDVYCDILSKDGASHVNARATLSNGWTLKENGGGTVCIYSVGPFCIFGTCPLRVPGRTPNILTQVFLWFSSDPPGKYFDSALNLATTSSPHILSRKLHTNIITVDSVRQDLYSDNTEKIYPSNLKKYSVVLERL
jgi:hypothetical protein